MKIMVITSSPNIEGLTESCATAAEKGMKEETASNNGSFE